MKVVHQNSEVEKSDHRQEQEQQLYEVLKELPKPETAMKLNAAQKKWWYWFGYEFTKTKQLAKIDLPHLQKAAIWMDARCKAVAAINQKKGIAGWVQTFEKGYTNVTGYVSVLEKADKHLDEVSAHFGMSIKDRKKLGASASSDNQLSLFDEVLKKIHG